MSREKFFLNRLNEWRSLDGEGWQAATPSFQIQAYHAGRLQIDLSLGAEYRFYDWASLTKIVFSTTSAMQAVASRELALSDKILDWLPELGLKDSHVRSRVLAQIQVRDLLRHHAGMTWWKPFYKNLDRMKSKRHEDRWSKLIDLVFKDVRVRTETGELMKARQGPAVYSDLDFFLLGEILRRATMMDFSTRWAKIADRLGLAETRFHVENENPDLAGLRSAASVRQMTAPTEIDPRRGKRPVQALVHDENTSSLMGVAPHAGLFGPMRDLSQYGIELRKLTRGQRSLLPETGAEFVRRALPRAKGDWALGFMMPTKGKASCGTRFSLSSIGHTGFTGTSLWYDPKADVLVSILSNRVCPTRDNTRFQELRPALHTMVMDALRA